jgi:mono/diheme cytochrome c family protein
MLPVAGCLALALGSGLNPLLARTPPVAGSAGDYTAAEAASGAKLYATECSACHGATLRGGLGPALTGDAFTSQWTGEPANDVYAMMAKNMPQNAPGTLTQGQALALMAFILQRNDFPAGTTPLTQAKLLHIKLVSPPSSE